MRQIHIFASGLGVPLLNGTNTVRPTSQPLPITAIGPNGSHWPDVFRCPPRLIQKSWATATKACAVIHMSAIPNKVILLEPGAAPVVIEVLLNRGAHGGLSPSSLFCT